MLGVVVGVLVGAFVGDVGAPLVGAFVSEEGRQFGGTIFLFEIPLLIPHPFLSVLPDLSTWLSHMQLDGAQPSWQYPHGTKSHDAQPF